MKSQRKGHTSFHGHTKTKFILIDTHQCQACWKCVEICPNQVLGKVSVFFHQHVRVDQAEACKGCKKCVKVCPNAAIRYTYTPSLKAKHESEVHTPLQSP
jgi:Pyruvate/2-oxoacid:ferredoxin oxidoreductase delta subunit